MKQRVKRTRNVEKRREQIKLLAQALREADGSSGYGRDSRFIVIGFEARAVAWLRQMQHIPDRTCAAILVIDWLPTSTASLPHLKLSSSLSFHFLATFTPNQHLEIISY